MAASGLVHGLDLPTLLSDGIHDSSLSLTLNILTTCFFFCVHDMHAREEESEL